MAIFGTSSERFGAATSPKTWATVRGPPRPFGAGLRLIAASTRALRLVRNADPCAAETCLASVVIGSRASHKRHFPWLFLARRASDLALRRARKHGPPCAGRRDRLARDCRRIAASTREMRLVRNVGTRVWTCAPRTESASMSSGPSFGGDPIATRLDPRLETWTPRRCASTRRRSARQRVNSRERRSADVQTDVPAHASPLCRARAATWTFHGYFWHA
jgi:hypothetical protein